MAKIICVANLVKGAGRTLSAVNFAASLSLLEKKTLIIDCDPLKDTSEYFGYTKEKYDYGLDDLLTGFVGGKGVVAGSDLEYLDVIPSGHDLSNIDENLAYNPDKERVLTIIIKKFREDYDYIIFDTPAEYSLLTKSAMLASDELLIPLKCDDNVAENLSRLLESVEEVREDYKAVIKTTGILFTFCENLEVVETFFSEEVVTKLKDVFFKTTIPESVFFDEEVNKKQPACLIDLKSDIADSFLDVTYEFLDREI